MNGEKSFKKFIILWLSQCVSGIGSSMTGFALVLWAYEQSHSAMSVSVMSFCNYVPYVILSLFVGSFIDRHSKKTIMLVADCFAAAGSLTVLAFLLTGRLAVWNIYVINVVVGITNAFQQPASAVATGRLVPEEKISNVSGMNSFSHNLIVVFSPMLAAFFFAAGGLPVILLVDLASFAIAFCVLLFFITIPEQEPEKMYRSPFAGIAEGIPIGIILGGCLADYIFEPFMSSGGRLAKMLGIIVGNSAGSGMAVMFLCTGICGFTVSIVSRFNREIRKLNRLGL